MDSFRIFFPRLRKQSLLVAATISILVSSAYAATHRHDSLKKINQRIASIKTTLSRDQNKRSQYLKKLRISEISSGKLRLKLHRSSQQLKKQRQLLATLRRHSDRYQSKLQQQQTTLDRQIRAAYLLNRQPQLKLLLNENDSERTQHVLMYYRYISNNQLQMIEQLQQTLTELQDNQAQIQTQTQVLQRLQRQQQTEQQRLEKAKHERRQALVVLNSEISNKNQRLATLLSNKRSLEHTLARLEQDNRAAMPQNFVQLKGKLHWPTRGKVLPYFGTKIYHSQLSWDGLLIKAPVDRPVYAVASGKVAFAKWLPGYGLLLIISHGHGYMTLYGRNHNLYKKPGDAVKQGDLIATVGQSGGYDQTALYFAIRHNAKPLNPVAWCHGRAQRRN